MNFADFDIDSGVVPDIFQKSSLNLQEINQTGFNAGDFDGRNQKRYNPCRVQIYGDDEEANEIASEGYAIGYEYGSGAMD